MTENQWPEDPTRPRTANPDAGERADIRGATTDVLSRAPLPWAMRRAPSRKDAAKDEATDVARTAADSAQNVAQTAKEEAANVASEAKSSAKDLMNQAKSGLTSQAGTQQQKAAEGIRNISTQLHSMADAPDQQGMASDLIRQAADRSFLQSRPGSRTGSQAILLGEVQRFARNKPGTFLLLAAGAGVLAGRLTRGLTAGAPETLRPDGPAQALGSLRTRRSAGRQLPPEATAGAAFQAAVTTAGLRRRRTGQQLPSSGSASSWTARNWWRSRGPGTGLRGPLGDPRSPMAP